MIYGASGPDVGLAACRLPDGRRSWGNTRDEDVLDEMVSEEFCGLPAQLGVNGAFRRGEAPTFCYGPCWLD